MLLLSIVTVVAVTSCTDAEAPFTEATSCDPMDRDNWIYAYERFTYLGDGDAEEGIAVVSGGTDRLILNTADWDESHPLNDLTTPDLSPDGSGLLFTVRGFDPEESQVWVADNDGSQPQLVAEGGGHDAVWSPDGTRIAFVRTDANPRVPQKIVVVDADGGNETVVAEDLSYLVQNVPVWSPDGKYVAIVHRAYADRITWHEVDGDGSGEAFVEEYGPWQIRTPVWLPDGDGFLANVVFEGERHQTYEFGLNGAGTVEHPDPAHEWSEFIRLPDGTSGGSYPTGDDDTHILVSIDPDTGNVVDTIVELPGLIESVAPGCV